VRDRNKVGLIPIFLNAYIINQELLKRLKIFEFYFSLYNYNNLG